MTNKEIYKEICPDYPVPVFAQTWWLDIVCPNWEVVLTKKGDRYTGCWAYPLESKMNVSIIRTPRLTPYLGPVVFFPHDLKESNRDSFEHETITELFAQIPPAQVWHLALQPRLRQAGLFSNFQFDLNVRQTFITDLTKETETLFANLKDSLRKNNRQAETEFYIVDNTEHLSRLFEFQSITLAKKNKSQYYSLEDMRRLLDGCTRHHSGKLWSAIGKDDGKLHAVVFQVWDKECSYYLAGAQSPESNSHKAMSLLLWHSMKYAKELGIPKFDFEGSMDPGVERFFRGFGGEKALYMVLSRNNSLVWKLKQLIFR